jgi:hypothetical protein
MDWILSCKPHKAVRFPLQIYKSKFTKTKMVWQLRLAMRWHHGMYISDILKFSPCSFFPSPTASCCLSLPLSISLGAGLVLCYKLSGSVDLVALCLSAFRSLCCLLNLFVWFWVPGPPGCSIIPTRMFSELGLMPLFNGSNVLWVVFLLWWSLASGLQVVNW